MSDPTAVFSIYDERDQEIRSIVQEVYDALKEKGYNPINQLVGYILSEDPTYITTYKNARSLIRKVDRDDLLQVLSQQKASLKSIRRSPRRRPQVFLRGPVPLAFLRLFSILLSSHPVLKGGSLWRPSAFYSAWPGWIMAATKAFS